MYTLKTESSISKIRQAEAIPMNEYEKGLALLDQLVTDYPNEVARIATKTLGTNYMMVSKEKLKQVIKQALMDQNTEFIGQLAEFMVSVRKKQVASVSRELKSLETKLSAVGDEPVSGAMWTKGEAKYNEAIAWLESKGYTAAEAEMIISNKGENAPELAKFWKEPFDWNKVLDTTGKVAQSLFFFGNMFSKTENPTPTITDATQKTDVDRRKMIRNIVIVAVVLIGLGVGAYFIFRKK